MAELSVDCPQCGEPNVLPVESDQETFTCSKCGATSPVDAAVMTGTVPAPDYLVGEIISDCKVLKKVGEGGFGSVYRATDQNLQRTVAVKVMLPSLTTNAEFVQKFLREAVTAAQLNHPNIVAIHRVGKDERRGMHYLIMEFVEGRTLADIVKEKGVLGWQEALPIFLQTCDALATAHERNIVHRDIKPENLMLDRTGTVKVTDFGLAKSITSDQKTTKVMGTPHYMSPEQFEGKSVDGRSDIYSLGTTFFYLLSKSRPYEGQNTVQIIYSILTQQPKSLTDLNKDVPPALWAVVEKMIAKKPEDRYQTLRDTIVDLRKLQGTTTQDDKAACPGCGTRNPKSRKFCRSCGAPLVVPCPACGSPEPAGTKECSSCHADLDSLVRVKKALEAAHRFQALGDLRRAAEGFRQVLQIDPNHAEARAEVDRLGATIEEVERVSSETQEMMRTGAVEEALGRVEDLLRRYPTAAEVRQQRDELRQSLADRRVNHLVEQAEAHAQGGRLREALEALDQALRIDPGREDVQTLRTDLGRRVASASENRQRAAEALAAGRYEEAYQLATEVLKAMPGDAAMEDLRRRARSSVESVDQFVERGRKREAERKFADALAEYETALSIRPSDARILELVQGVRARIAEQRERIAHGRRLLADRQYREATEVLRAVLADAPDDLEARSLLASCERGREEAERLAAVEHGIDEAGRLEAAGDLAKALEVLDGVAKLDPENEVARTRREQIERRFREEKALRELADEHLADGLFADAVESLLRLKSVAPSRAKPIDAEIAEAKRREALVRTNLDLAEKSLGAREYRRAGDAAKAVLDVAPKHPRAAAIRKDAEKAVTAIDRFLAECDKFLVAEMFDEALDALDKAKERGATAEECRHRREQCEQGRLALLKTDATRSIVMKDFEAAIAAYENVLEVRKDDKDALEGKRRAERRLRIQTTEPLLLRAGAAAIVLLSLGLVQYTAVASTRELAVVARVEVNREQEDARVIKQDTRKLVADLRAASEAEGRRDWAAAENAYAAEQAEFPADPRLAAGRSFAAAIQEAGRAGDSRTRLAALAKAQEFLGDVADVRTARAAEVARLRDEAVDAEMKAAEALEATDARAALARYQSIQDDPVGRQSPAIERIDRLQVYLQGLRAAEIKKDAGNFRGAAQSYFAVRSQVADDARRVEGVDAHLARLRSRWMESVRAAGADSAADDEAYYERVVKDLAEMSRILGLPRERVLDEFRKGR